MQPPVVQNIFAQPTYTQPLYNHPPVDYDAEKDYNPIDWFMKALKNYATFQGRARRKEYWFFSLGVFIVYIITMLIDYLLFTDTPVFTVIAMLGLALPGLAVAVRRLHDTNHSGWAYLISFIPLIGGIILFVWLVSDTKRIVNEYGLPSKL